MFFVTQSLYLHLGLYIQCGTFRWFPCFKESSQVLRLIILIEQYVIVSPKEHYKENYVQIAIV